MKPIRPQVLIALVCLTFITCFGMWLDVAYPKDLDIADIVKITVGGIVGSVGTLIALDKGKEE